MSDELKNLAAEIVEGFAELTEENKRVITAYGDGLAMGAKIAAAKQRDGEDGKPEN